MKIKWNKKYAQVSFWVCTVVFFTVVCVFFFMNYNDFGAYMKKIMSVLNPIIYGVVIAYVLNKIMVIYETKVFNFLDTKPGCMRLKRNLSIVSTYITAILLISGFVWLIVPQVVEGLKDLLDKIPLYIADFENWLYDIVDISPEIYDIVMKGLEYISNLYGALDQVLETIMPKITDWLSNILTFLKDLAIGIVLSVYFLRQKEKFVAQGKRLTRAVFADSKYNSAISLMKSIDNSFGGYLVAMGVDSLLVMMESFLLFSLAGIPYVSLISFIVGVTNFIPFFGPFIGAVPSAIIICIVDPFKVIPFVLLILLIQQIDGNIIAPRIIGSHIGISSVWVVIAITIMSGLFGFVGMVIGVPLFSVIYTLIDNAIAGRLEKKNCDTDIIDFYSDENVMGKTMEMEMMYAQERRSQKEPVLDRILTFLKIKNKKIGFIHKKTNKTSSWDDSVTVEEIINDFNSEYKGFESYIEEVNSSEDEEFDSVEIENDSEQQSDPDKTEE